MLVLLPIQIKQSRMAKDFSIRGEIPEKYWLLSKYWAVFGVIATILPLANLYFMVFKPA